MTILFLSEMLLLFVLKMRLTVTPVMRVMVIQTNALSRLC